MFRTTIVLLSLTKIAVNFSILARTSYTENAIKVCFFQKWDEAITCEYIAKVSQVMDWLSLTPRKIEIRNQNLEKLQSGDFSKLRFVKELVIQNSKLTDIELGTFVSSLSLLKLDLQSNELQYIRTGVFNDLLLSSINLNNNRIKTIEKDALSYMQNLEEIFLENNLLVTFDSDWFYKTPLLKDLHFENNSIVNITQQAFRNLGNKIVSPNIYLSFNKINYIDERVFDGLGNTTIGKLYLDHNLITQLNEGWFININELKISFNKIECISARHEIVRNNDERNFEHNPYNCTCLKEIKTVFDREHSESAWFMEKYLECRNKIHSRNIDVHVHNVEIFSSS